MKERIVGAVVLVVFVVLVVPIFLDGPPPGGEIVSERLLLPGQDDQNVKTVILDRGRSVPVPAASSVEEPAAASPDAASEETSDVTRAEEEPQLTVEKREPAPVEVATKPPQKSAPEAATVSSTGMWAVQLGSFSNKENAEKLAADLRKQGYAAFLSQLSQDGQQLHRVRIGPQADRPGAEETAAKLARVGHKGQVVPHP